MQWLKHARHFWLEQRRRSHAWGAILGQQDILLAALSLQKSGTVRVLVYERQHVPEGLLQSAERDDWMVQTLRGLSRHVSAQQRTMVLALDPTRCRQGVLEPVQAMAPHQLQAEVQLEAASVWGVTPDEVGFDFRTDARRVHWAACLQKDLRQWRGHARNAGWRLPAVEPDDQAAQRAVLHWRGNLDRQSADSPQDWQFSRAPERGMAEVDWPAWQSGPLWSPLVACGAALRVLV